MPRRKKTESIQEVVNEPVNYSDHWFNTTGKELLEKGNSQRNVITRYAKLNDISVNSAIDVFKVVVDK